MKWALFSTVPLIFLAGCAGSPPADNPFLGPATVPPPSTGSAGATTQPPPYYPPNVQGGAAPIGSGARTAPSGSGYPHASSDTQPMRGVVSSQSPRANPVSLRRSEASNPANAQETSAAAQWSEAGTIQTASRDPLRGAADAQEHRGQTSDAQIASGIRIEEPVSVPAAAGVAGGPLEEPGRLQPPSSIIGMNTVQGAAPESSGRATFDPRGANGASTVAGAQVVESASALDDSASYDHEPNYAWLKGRLERSRVDGRWKLRYIPIDGDTDRFGGSVVLGESQLLEGYESGQLVAVEGELGDKNPADYGFAPSYTLHRVAALDRR